VISRGVAHIITGKLILYRERQYLGWWEKKIHTHLEKNAVKSNWMISTKIGMKILRKKMCQITTRKYLLDVKKIQNRSSCRLVVLSFDDLVAEKKLESLSMQLFDE